MSNVVEYEKLNYKNLNIGDVLMYVEKHDPKNIWICEVHNVYPNGDVQLTYICVPLGNKNFLYKHDIYSCELIGWTRQYKQL